MMSRNTRITVTYDDKNTILKINGDYEIIGFFPESKGMNMVVVLKRKDKKNGKKNI